MPSGSSLVMGVCPGAGGDPRAGSGCRGVWGHAGKEPSAGSSGMLERDVSICGSSSRIWGAQRVPGQLGHEGVRAWPTPHPFGTTRVGQPSAGSRRKEVAELSCCSTRSPGAAGAGQGTETAPAQLGWCSEGQGWRCGQARPSPDGRNLVPAVPVGTGTRLRVAPHATVRLENSMLPTPAPCPAGWRLQPWCSPKGGHRATT